MLSTLANNLTFVDFTLDPDRCVLQHDGKEIPLRPKSFDVLRYLVQHSGRVVSRAELLGAVWPDVVVTDNSLDQCLADIRRALGDERHEIIRTMPRRGYLFDLPEDSPRAEGDEASPAAGRSANRVRWGLVVTIAVSVLLAALWWRVERQPAAEAGLSISPSIAVLPFADLSPLGDHEYLADGVAEEILNLLSQVDGLTVMARTSSFAFKGQNPDLGTVARRLKVSHVLEGSVRVAGGRVRITAQLIDAASGAHLWSDAFDEALRVDHLLEIQDRTAEAIIRALRVEVLPEELPLRDVAHGPANIEALNHYLEGQLYLRRIETGLGWYTPETFDAGEQYFTASIAADPGWAPAHVALGRLYHFRSDLAPTYLARAEAEVLEGLRLDPGYAPAYASLGYIRYRQRDFEAALQAFADGRALGSEMTWAYAILLNALGRFDEAVEEYRKAIVRDPISELLRLQLGYTLRCAGRYAEAEAVYGQLIEANPDDLTVRLRWIESKLRVGKAAEALPWLERLTNKPPEPISPETLAYLWAMAGQLDRVHSLLDGSAAPDEILPLQVEISALMGDTEAALHALERAAEEIPSSLLHIRCLPEVRALAGNPRYEAALDTVGFPR